MGPLQARLQDLIEPTVTALGYELLGIEFQGQGQQARLRLYIDKETGITLDDCEAVSHQVSGVLDVEDLIHGRYTLEVSSPGLDRPLFKPAHYARFVGHSVRLRLFQPMAGARNIKGRLESVSDQSIVIQMEDGKQAHIAFTNIQKANLVPASA